MNLSEFLKTETRELHARAESQPVEKALFGGQISPQAYAHWLKQRAAIHEVLEQRLLKWQASDKRVDPLLGAPCQQAQRAVDDIGTLAHDNNALPVSGKVEAYAAACDKALANNPTWLLGGRYVLEGSKNGGRFLARALAGRLTAEHQAATTYLNPHGEEQPALWGAWKQNLDAIEFSEAERTMILEGARAMYDAVIEIDTQLDPQLGLTTTAEV